MALASNQVNIGTKDKPNIVTAGSSGSTSSSSKSSAPAYNSKTGKTTGKASTEYTSYLKSLNKQGSANYINADAGEYVDATGTKKTGTNFAPEATTPIEETPANTPVDTSQPSPQAASTLVQNQAPTAQNGALNGTLAANQVNTGTATAPNIQTPYQTAHSALQSTTAPQNAGEAMAQAKGAIPATQDFSTVETALAADKGFQQLEEDRKALANFDEQSTSLVDMYKKLTKQAGIQDINTELINMKNVIEGTEDDIRNEVQSASGFATDSQVMALAASRNKQLIKNYNTLLDTKNAQTEYVDKMMGFAQADRQTARQSLMDRLQFDQQEIQYRDKFVANAQESYNNVIKLAGADGLYNSIKNDPNALNLASKVLGMSPEMLAQAATAASTARAKQDQMDNLDIQSKQESILTDRAQRANIYSEINNRNNPAPKELSQAQNQALGYGVRTLQAAQTINSKNSSGIGALASGNLGSFQEINQAQRNFINAVLRRESGAAIAPSEFKNARKQYFPQPFDSAKTLALKSQNRNTVIQNLLREGGQGDVDPSKLTVSPEGHLIEIQ